MPTTILSPHLPLNVQFSNSDGPGKSAMTQRCLDGAMIPMDTSCGANQEEIIESLHAQPTQVTLPAEPIGESITTTTLHPKKLALAIRYSRAVAACNEGMSIREAAARFTVGREALRQRVNGNLPIECQKGPKITYITEGTNTGLLEAIEYRSSHGMCIGTAEFRDLVRQSALATSLKDIPDDFPNAKWIQRWVKRHAHLISYRKGQILDIKRAECSTEETVRYYYGNLNAAITELGLTEKPGNIWNCDETGMTAQGHAGQRVLCPKGKSANIRRSSDRENVSMMGCISANGERMPPMFIFAGAKRKVQWMARAPAGSVCAVTESSNINGALFLNWLKWFVTLLPNPNEKPDARPQLLVLDGHYAHVTVAAVKFGLDNGVHMFVLPAHTSHFLQPLDVSVYQPFKSIYEKAVQRYPLEHGGALPVKDDVAALACPAFETAFNVANIKKGFEHTGIYPLSIDVMLQKLIGKSKPKVKASTCGPPNPEGQISVEIGVRHHKVLAPLFTKETIGARATEALKRRRYSLDALNVAHISLRMLIEPVSQQRPKGAFVDESVSGGKLLTYEDMLAEQEAKRAAKAAKTAAKAEAAVAREAKRAKAAADKAEAAAAKAQARARAKESKRAAMSAAAQQRTKKRRVSAADGSQPHQCPSSLTGEAMLSVVV